MSHKNITLSSLTHKKSLGIKSTLEYELDYDEYQNTGKDNGTLTVATDLDTTNLKMEYIATSQYANSSTWTPTYNAYSGTTSIPSGITYDSTSASYLFGTLPTGIEPPYENGAGTYTYDLENNNGLTYEAWVSYSGTEGSIANSRGWLMTFETGRGPALVLNEPKFDNNDNFDSTGLDGNIGTMSRYTNSASDFVNAGNTPGSIASYTGKVHIVSTMYQGTRSVFVNGAEYPMKDNSPMFLTGADRAKTLTIGSRDSMENSMEFYCPGVRIYSFRVWHESLTQANVSELYNRGASESVFATTRCDASGYRIPEIEHTKVVLNGTLLNEVCCPDAVARVLEAGTSSCESIHSFTPISLSLYINIKHSSYHKKLHFQTNSNTKTQLRATMVVSVTHRLDSSTIRTAMSPSIQAVT